ncbi:hypothetical protein GCM10012289_69400 [Nonomuraea cavernae]|uniref:Uncharacterized protein n=1 Tax=Nonomuraea cavernae TaxID=2045107 RepID=A0A918DT96_9ACTN|nr:hypothetical protein GCM10012289_69400 [Nonomuraea cavernae]
MKSTSPGRSFLSMVHMGHDLPSVLATIAPEGKPAEIAAATAPSCAAEQGRDG